MILAFFAASDGIVLENLGMRFMSEVQMAEAKASQYKKNRDLYQQLVVLHPQNETYQAKVEFYSNKAAEQEKKASEKALEEKKRPDLYLPESS